MKAEKIAVQCDGNDGDGSRCDRLLLVPRTTRNCAHYCPEHQTGTPESGVSVDGE